MILNDDEVRSLYLALAHGKSTDAEEERVFRRLETHVQELDYNKFLEEEEGKKRKKIKLPDRSAYDITVFDKGDSLSDTIENAENAVNTVLRKNKKCRKIFVYEPDLGCSWATVVVSSKKMTEEQYIEAARRWEAEEGMG